jgi:hypothetical protein
MEFQKFRGINVHNASILPEQATMINQEFEIV